MNQDKSFQLRFKVLMGMGLFAVLIVLNGLYQYKTIRLTEQNHRLLGELNLLENTSQGFTRRAGNYVENAARDFESYKRDVQIFHKDILADIEQFTGLLDNLSNQFNKNVGLALPATVGSLFGQKESVEQLEAAVNATQSEWKRFNEGLQEKLGEDKDEPRIEWGAQFIVDRSVMLNRSIDVMTKQYRAFLQQQGMFVENILTAILIITIILGVLGFIWFYQRVIKRIGTTVDACLQVANGDFGYKLTVEGNDEITVLSRAFNALSSRSQLVLAMLGELQQAYSNEQALDIICQSAGGYLPIAWAGLLEVGADNKTLSIQSAIPSQSTSKWNTREMMLTEGFGQEIANAIMNKEPAMISSLRQHVVANPNERLLRDLVRSTQVDALVALPLTSRRGWEGVLLFGSRSGEYRTDQTELLQRLAPLMANSFERIQTGGEQSTVVMTS